MNLIKRLTAWNVRLWKGIWAVLRSMGNWKGVVSLITVWIVISGAGVAIVGVVIQNNYLIGLGSAIFAFWAGPFTPLIPLNIALAMAIQRFVFRDKSITIKSIKEKFKQAFQKNKDNGQSNLPSHKDNRKE